MGEMIEFPGRGHVDHGYMATPVAGSGPGVVVVQEWWGLVPHIMAVCDRLAGEGFTALAPDLYHGTATTEPDEAQKEMMKLEMGHAGDDLAGAVAHLLDSPSATGRTVAVIGFCMGGGLALHISSTQPEVSACVTYYGRPRAPLDLSTMNAAVLGHWGERDHSYDHAAIDDLEQQLREAGVEVQSYWYDADHAFFNDDRPQVYDEEAAQLSWERTVAFLHQHLRA